MPERRSFGHARSRASFGWGRSLLPIAILAATLPVVAQHVSAVDVAELGAAAGAIAPGALAAAVCATIVGFSAIGRFDGLVHRWLGTGADDLAARRVGAASVAVAQTLGFGLVTGALARWRGLPGLPLVDCARVTGAVAVAFLAALAVVVAGTVAVWGVPGPAPAWIALPGFAVLLLAPLMSLAPRPAWLSVPPLRLLGGLMLLAFVDIAAAAAVFWLLIPADPSLALAAVAPAFVIALAAGLLSGTPAGVGPFEMTLLALLPAAPTPELLAAILVYRLVYHAAPAIVGATFLALRHEPGPAAAPHGALDGLLPRARRAEAALVRQGELSLAGARGVTFVTGVTAQAVVAVGDPVLPAAHHAALAALSDLARARGRVPLFYKCDARLAAAARRAGWRVAALAEEAWIDPRRFRLDRPACRTLRRKWRAAEAAGLEVAVATRPLPMSEMAEVADEWSRLRGGENGFSMGRFAAHYVADQRVYLARANGRLVAFVSFHEGAREWTLDLVRCRADAPDGATYALVVAAIADASAAGLPRLSLAAVPAARGLPARLARGDGLRRFKAAFAPNWEPLFAAAPSRFALAAGLWDVAWRVHRPGALASRHAAGSRSL